MKPGNGQGYKFSKPKPSDICSTTGLCFLKTPKFLNKWVQVVKCMSLQQTFLIHTITNIFQSKYLVGVVSFIITPATLYLMILLKTVYF